MIEKQQKSIWSSKLNLSLEKICLFLEIPINKKMELDINGASIDTRTIKSGNIFFALKGERFDGHHYINEAIENGAVVVVVEKEFIIPSEIENKCLFLKVPDTVKALQKIAACYREMLDILVITITGSNGKTTTKEMIAELLSAKYRTKKSQGNYNNHIGVPLSILEWDENCEIGILELGANHFNEIDQLCSIACPTHGVITNIGKGHLEFFSSLEGVARAKAEMIPHIKNKENIFLNGDDPYLYPLKDRYKNLLFYGFKERCDIKGTELKINSEGYPGMKVENHEIKLGIPGFHNLNNSLAAISVAKSFGIKWDEIKKRLAGFKAVAGRLEIEHLENFSIINDSYNANPSSVIESLNLLKLIKKKGRSIAVLGDMLELGACSEQEHKFIGKKAAAMGIDALFCYGNEMAYAGSEALKSGLKNTFIYNLKTVLLKELLNFLDKGDYILVKGSRSMNMQEIIESLKQNK